MILGTSFWKIYNLWRKEWEPDKFIGKETFRSAFTSFKENLDNNGKLKRLLKIFRTWIYSHIYERIGHEGDNLLCRVSFIHLSSFRLFPRNVWIENNQLRLDAVRQNVGTKSRSECYYRIIATRYKRICSATVVVAQLTIHAVAAGCQVLRDLDGETGEKILQICVSSRQLVVADSVVVQREVAW